MLFWPIDHTAVDFLPLRVGDIYIIRDKLHLKMAQKMAPHIIIKIIF